MEYRVIINKTNVEIAESVNTLINQGWQLQGGVSISLITNGVGQVGVKETFVYAQAMIKP